MNNEPVAWMDKRTNKCVVFINTPPSDDWIPLYTHPVKEQEFLSGKVCPSCGCNSLLKTNRSEWCVTHKCLWQSDYDLELTDEEIFKEMEFLPSSIAITNEDLIKFAKAILRKAQEK